MRRDEFLGPVAVMQGNVGRAGKAEIVRNGPETVRQPVRPRQNCRHAGRGHRGRGVDTAYDRVRMHGCNHAGMELTVCVIVIGELPATCQQPQVFLAKWRVAKSVLH